MKNLLSSITIICIIIALIFSSCSITKKTTCPTFSNKTKKVHKPLFSQKSSSKKKQRQFTKVTNQEKKKNAFNSSFAKIESIFSQVKTSDLTADSGNNIALNSADISPSFIESKLQKIIYKKNEKRNNLNIIKKHDKKIKVEKKKSDKQVISQKTHKTKRRKILNGKNNNPTDKRETQEYALIALIASILTYITPFFGLIFGSPWVFVVSGFTLAVLSIIWGTIAKKKIKEEPDKYRGNNMAFIATTLGTIAMSILFAFVGLLIFTSL